MATPIELVCMMKASFNTMTSQLLYALCGDEDLTDNLPSTFLNIEDLVLQN